MGGIDIGEPGLPGMGRSGDVSCEVGGVGFVPAGGSRSVWHSDSRDFEGWITIPWYQAHLAPDEWGLASPCINRTPGNWRWV